MLYLANSINLNMMPVPAYVSVNEVSAFRAKQILGSKVSSIIDRDTVANLYSSLLGVDIVVSYEPQNIELAAGDTLILGQYSGPRLEEGATELPAGAHIKWLFVRVE